MKVIIDSNKNISSIHTDINLLNKFNLADYKYYKEMKEELKYKERIEHYQVQLEFIDPETMQIVEDKNIALWMDSNNILKASIHVYDNIRKPLIVKIKDKL